MSEPAADSQDALVLAATQGERLAIERLFLMLHPRLRNRIARKIPAELNATLGPDDVLQETYAKAIRSIHTVEPGSVEQFYRWIATVAEHRLLDMIRERKAIKRGGGRVQVDAGGGDEDAGDNLLDIAMQHLSTPSRVIGRNEAGDALKAALSVIEPDYREAITLRYIKGLPVAEIAEQMQRTDRAVHMLCNRGLKALRSVLGRSSEYLSQR